MLGAMRAIGQGAGEIEPSRDFAARLWQRIDAWETGRRALWTKLLAGFFARNRRLVVTSAVTFAVALAGGLYIMKGVVGPDMAARQTAAVDRGTTSYEGVGLATARPEAGAPSGLRQDYVQDYVLREIPYSAPVLRVSDSNTGDTIYVRFPTREIAPPRGMAGDNYIYQPVTTPVSESEPIF
jgi:hypothetical protein